jgi:hypothetical protein
MHRTTTTHRTKEKWIQLSQQLVSFFTIHKQPKIFCIGLNKTGTTSMEAIFRMLPIPVGNQRRAEKLTIPVIRRDCSQFQSYVRHEGVAFQDNPFCIPDLHKWLDQEFPNSKFIITVRDSPEVWYDSLVRFHAKIFGNGKIPTQSDLMQSEYVHKGWFWEKHRLVYGTPENDIYNKEILIQHYIDYNNQVMAYFADQPDKLLVINLKEPHAAQTLSRFLNAKRPITHIPWENKT